MTDYNKLLAKIEHIKECDIALRWLEEFGEKSATENFFRIIIYQNYAGSCVGAGEAAKVLIDYTRLAMPEIVKSAITSCRNTIQIELDAITDELAKKAVPE